jgi:hypothetical protein
MNILAHNFALQKANELHKMFPTLVVRYEYKKNHKTHFIQILKDDITENSIFVDFYLETTKKFTTMFDDEDLVFISDNILIVISNPIYTSIEAKVNTSKSQLVKNIDNLILEGEKSYAMAA